MINCVNCGAPIKGNKCEYCGTEYSEDGRFVEAAFGTNDAYGTLRIGDKFYEVYIGSMKAECIDSFAGRTLDGRMHRQPILMKHKFTLIER